MVNEEMLKSVNKVLQKVDELSSLESLDYLIEQYGINCNGLTKKEIIDLILVNVLSLEEYRYYKHYVLYEEQKKNNLLIEAVGNIERITNETEVLYEKRRKLLQDKRWLEDHIRKIHLELRKVPIIRAKIQYGHVVNAFDNYLKAKVRAGLKETELSDNLKKMNSSNIIIRTMKKKKIDALSLELSEVCKIDEIRIKDFYSVYENEIKEYCKILKNLFNEMLKNNCIKNAAILTINMKYDDCYGIGDFSNSVIPNLSSDVMNAVDLDDMYTKFIEIADFSPEDEITSELFYEKLEYFVTYYFKAKSGKAEWQSISILKDIQAMFVEQRSIIDDLSKYSYEISSQKEFSDDDKETFALIYSNNVK